MLFSIDILIIVMIIVFKKIIFQKQDLHYYLRIRFIVLRVIEIYSVNIMVYQL